jgi:CheY-like chemotaxis protein
MSLPDARLIEILLVDDDPGDVLMVREPLGTATPSTRLQVLRDGSEVIPYLRREGDHVGARRPDLILLDLNLPGRHGRQALADIKGDPDLRRRSPSWC